MFNNQNIQVKTKFQNASNSVSSKMNSSKFNTLPLSARTERSPRYVNQSKVMGSETKKEPVKTTDAFRSMPKLKAKSLEICAVSKGRSGTDTLNQISRRFVSTFRSSNHRPTSSKIFDYHLSQEEKSVFGQAHSPMKSVPVKELELLRSGQRVSYLETRYERTPDNKYNYPEATSWRYGWFHNKTT